jgi:tetratricopeptide (TPR) repeat protein
MKTNLSNIALAVVAAAACCATVVHAQEMESLLASEANLGMKEMAAELTRRDAVLAQKEATISELRAAFEEIRVAFGAKAAEFGPAADELRNLIANAQQERDAALVLAREDGPNAVQRIVELEAAVRAQQTEVDALLKQLDEARQARDQALMARDKAIGEREEMVGSFDASLGAQRQKIEEREAILMRAMGDVRRQKVTLAYNIGCVYKASKQYSKAEHEFMKALALAPQDAAIHFNLGVLYDDNMRQPDKARQQYQKFLELAPQDDDAPRVIEWLKGL